MVNFMADFFDTSARCHLSFKENYLHIHEKASFVHSVCVNYNIL